MGEFDFFVLIVAIPIGLALVEIAQGVSIALRQRAEVEIGWTTPLLALFLIMCTAAVWEVLWKIRQSITADWLIIAVGLLAAAIYCISASFIFPHKNDNHASLDDWFMKNRKISLGGPLVLMLLFTISNFSWSGEATDARIAIIVMLTIFYLLPAGVAIFSRVKRNIVVALVFLNAMWLIPAFGAVIA